MIEGAQQEVPADVRALLARSSAGKMNGGRDGTETYFKPISPVSGGD